MRANRSAHPAPPLDQLVLYGPSSSSFDLDHHSSLLLSAVRSDSLLVPSSLALYRPSLEAAVRECLVVRPASCLLLAGILHAQSSVVDSLRALSHSRHAARQACLRAWISWSCRIPVGVRPVPLHLVGESCRIDPWVALVQVVPAALPDRARHMVLSRYHSVQIQRSDSVGHGHRYSTLAASQTMQNRLLSHQTKKR